MNQIVPPPHEGTPAQQAPNGDIMPAPASISSTTRLRISTGSPKAANTRNSNQTLSTLEARITAAAASRMLTTRSERNITPRLQKFGNRIPAPV